MQLSESEVAKLISRPTLIAIAYGIVLGWRGQSWWWLLVAIIMPIIIGYALILRLRNGKPKNFLKLILYYFVELLAISLLGSITLRLAFYSGFWGMIQSIIHFNLLGILFAFTSLYFGRKLCIYFNRVYEILK